jgi:hypothetical protein
VLITSQSCIVYQKTSVTLNQAIDQGNAQVVTKAGKELEFKEIILKDNIYYGINRRSEISNIKLDSAYIASIYLKNNGKSIAATALLVTPFLALFIYSLTKSGGIF